MQRFTESIRASVKSKNWFAALFLALAIPDVCGALEEPGAPVGDRYKNWFNRYMRENYNPSNLFELLSQAAPQSLNRRGPEETEYLRSLPSNADQTLRTKRFRSQARNSPPTRETRSA